MTAENRRLGTKLALVERRVRDLEAALGNAALMYENLAKAHNMMQAHLQLRGYLPSEQIKGIVPE